MTNKTLNYLSVGLKGFGMGAANVIPGVSGGTIALITGIYSDIVDAISSFTAKSTWQALFHGKIKEFWSAIKGSFLLALGIGMLVSIFSLAKGLSYMLEYHPIPTWAFFFGLILASAMLMFRDIKAWGIKDIIFLVLGLALGVIVCTLSPTNTPDDLWFIFICGALSICSMILPGISGSFILLILGKYDYILKALTNLNLPVLLVFTVGCVVGILAFAKFLKWLLGRWEKLTMISLLGFVLGSLVKVWPWSNAAAIETVQFLREGSSEILDKQIPLAIICCILGIAFVAVIELISKRHKD